MIVVWIILILNLCAFSYAPEQPDEQDEIAINALESQIRYNPLVVVKKNFGRYKLPKTVIVKDGDRIFDGKSKKKVRYLCPTEDSGILKLIDEDPKLPLYWKDYCLFKQKFDPSKKKVCIKEPKPGHAALVGSTTGNLRCGPDLKGVLYGAMYRFCKLRTGFLGRFAGRKIKVDYFTIYEYCYDPKNKEVLYTWHKILSPALFENEERLGDFGVYKSDGEPMILEEFIEASNKIKERIEDEKKEKMIAHKLVPAEHMAFGLWKKPTYNYVNVKPMTPEMSAVWKFIDARIRLTAKILDSELNMYMGNFKFGAVDFWCKIVYSSHHGKGVAIIVRSKRDEPKSDDEKLRLNKLLQSCTEPLKCNILEWEGYDADKNLLVSIDCCNVRDPQLKLFGLPGYHFIESGYLKYLDLNNP